MSNNSLMTSNSQTGFAFLWLPNSFIYSNYLFIELFMYLLYIFWIRVQIRSIHYNWLMRLLSLFQSIAPHFIFLSRFPCSYLIKNTVICPLEFRSLAFADGIFVVLFSELLCLLFLEIGDCVSRFDQTRVQPPQQAHPIAGGECSQHDAWSDYLSLLLGSDNRSSINI